MNKRTFFVLLLVAIIAAGTGMWFGQPSNPAISGGSDKSMAKYTSITQYPKPKVIADFLLSDSDGKEFGLDNLRGRWSLLFFGFTHCPDICPTTLSTMASVYRKLEKQLPAEKLPAIIFVSIDPERDHLELIGSYVEFFAPEFTAVTGEHPQLTALTRQLGLLYTIEEHAPGVSDYIVDHSSGIILMNPDAELVGLLRTPHDEQQISTDLLQLLSVD
ncbi:MAG: SCO family protein [Xanthomonadales bacterium]|nr:SCO family protein [Xanthomonadales bacterium]